MTEYIKRKWWAMSPLMRRLCVAGAVLCFCCLIVAPASETDSDGDGMSNAFELFFQLDPDDPNDALENYDEDTLLNLEESVIRTDPDTTDTDRDGFHDGIDSNALSRAYIRWGDPWFTDGDEYDYAATEWIMGAYRIGGDWLTNPVCWHVSASESNNVGSLNVDLDRTILTNNIKYSLTFFDHLNGSLFVDLIDLEENFIAIDLFGNLHDGSDTEVTVLLDVPLSTYTNAAVIHIRRGSGECTVTESLLYIDEDGDFLDAAQERQIGTSDYQIDSDGDGLSDYDEVFVYGTDPANPDTDGDGMNDGSEVENGLNPLEDDARDDLDGDGVDNLTEILQGRDPTVGAVEDAESLVNLKIYTVLE